MGKTRDKKVFLNDHVYICILNMSNSRSCMDVRVGLGRKLSAEELMLLNSGAGEDS